MKNSNRVIYPLTQKPDNDSHSTPPRGFYLLPNLFTTVGLFAGFYAIVATIMPTANYEHAGIAIFIAMVMDGLDGRVARLTNTQSAFGAEYDSLSDMISFGLAPALMAFSWGLSSLGKIGWLVAFCYVAATALRLARFNTQIGSTDKKYFKGLPSPSAAALVASVVWVAYEYGLPGNKLWILAAIVTLCAAILMVSNVSYYSFKDIDLKNKVPFITILAAVSIIILVSIDPPVILLTFFLGYVLSGPAMAIHRYFKHVKAT
jgi:CDP-diacylglycerol--serine O-phosphatidyltransferase